MRTVSCIICPNSCSINIDEATLEATGNKCPRGLEFARQELTNPVRVITTTVKTIFPSFPVLPCKTSKPVTKSKVMEIMSEINKIVIDHPVNCGDVIINNILGMGVDLVATNEIKEK